MLATWNGEGSSSPDEDKGPTPTGRVFRNLAFPCSIIEIFAIIRSEVYRYRLPGGSVCVCS